MKLDMDLKIPSVSETNRLQDSQPKSFLIDHLGIHLCHFTSAWPRQLRDSI